MEGKDKFDLARELIRHEDGLINNRVTWLLVFQGFLFTAFVNGVGLFEKLEGRPGAKRCLTTALVVIGALGIASSLTALNVTRIAFEHMEEVKRWWRSQNVSGFPPLTGALGAGRFYKWFSTGRTPYVLVAVWGALIVLLAVGAS